MNFSTLRASKYSGLSVINTEGFGRRSILTVPRTLVESAAAGADVVMRLVGLQVLILVVEHHVAAGHRFVGLLVVLHVIGLQPLVGVVNVHGAIGDGQVALAFLRAAGGKLGHAALGGRFVTCCAGVRPAPKLTQKSRNGRSAVRANAVRGAEQFRAREL